MKKLDAVLGDYFLPNLQLGNKIRLSQGTLRSCTLKETLSLALKDISKFRISRISEITQLDSIGMPTFTVCVPEEVGESWCCGKGITREAALTSAILEAYEYRAAKNISRHFLPNLSVKEAKKFGKILHPSKCQHPMAKRSYPSSSRFDWIKCIEVNSGEGVILPSELISTHLKSSREVTSLKETLSTVGMATGNTIYETILHGIFERLEWDAFMLSNFITGKSLDLYSIPKSLAPLVSSIKNAKIELFIFDISTDIGVTAYQAYLAQESGLDAYHIHHGFGCHINPEIALSRAITEACQIRLTYFAGAREDVGEGVSPKEEYQELVKRSTQVTGFPTRPPGAKIKSFGAFLKRISNRLKRKGYDCIYVADLSIPGINFVSVGVYIPGLESLNLDKDEVYYPGKRARQAIKNMGKTVS